MLKTIHICILSCISRAEYCVTSWHIIFYLYLLFIGKMTFILNINLLMNSSGRFCEVNKWIKKKCSGSITKSVGQTENVNWILQPSLHTIVKIVSSQLKCTIEIENHQPRYMQKLCNVRKELYFIHINYQLLYLKSNIKVHLKSTVHGTFI